ncbi:hypothetical protein JOB18_031821 [Solea senegalensis]|uniref:Cation efflux protein cytoplasmic domain-containing protein n=1 Tax=Solea senegalensis TaxID=28829 RepID=A0AAV6Q024_SOLSE|nr:zinc transporter 1 [Solea senegalensis]KAG7479670.1 hypothetical protein JOB18_031821 [Solea senegalensis]
MTMLHWCLLGFTMLLLVCEIAISELCSSTMILVDSFHTLFILMRISLQTVLPSMESPESPPASPESPPASPSSIKPAETPVECLPGTDTAPVTCGSSTLNEPLNSLLNQEGASSLSSHQLCPPTVSPPTLGCGVSYSKGRIQVMGEFISSLTLSSLSISYLLNLISISMEPEPVQHPVLLVLVTVVTLLYKMLVLKLCWGELQGERFGSSKPTGAKSHLQGDSKGLAEPGRVLSDVTRVQSAADDSLNSGALVLYNPGATSIMDSDSQTPQLWRPDIHLHSNTEMSEDSTCMGHLDSQKESSITSVCKSLQVESPERSGQWPVWLLSLLMTFEVLFTSVLAVTNSTVVLLVGPQCLLSSTACGLLTYLNLGLSLLAVIILIIITIPQLHKYGLLLLQAAPPHLSVSDLGQRIARVPGVRAVHELHLWQLTPSFLVATVHVQCQSCFPAHRCADLMLEVTKVLQSIGVGCCTIQPEFVSCSECSALSLPPPACSLACGKACTGSMCCYFLEEQTSSVTAPPAGEAKEDHQTLQSVIENTSL